jgi:hypothetical protein
MPKEKIMTLQNVLKTIASFALLLAALVFHGSLNTGLGAAGPRPSETALFGGQIGMYLADADGGQIGRKPSGLDGGQIG